MEHQPVPVDFAVGEVVNLVADGLLLEELRQRLQTHFEVELRGRVGYGANGLREIKILNRIVRLDDRGLAYEADPRHVELLVKSLGLEGCRKHSSPGAKDNNPETMSDGNLHHEDESTNDLCAALVTEYIRKPNRKGHTVTVNEHANGFCSSGLKY